MTKLHFWASISLREKWATDAASAGLHAPERYCTIGGVERQYDLCSIDRSAYDGCKLVDLSYLGESSSYRVVKTGAESIADKEIAP